MATEQLKCGSSELRYTVNVKYIQVFKDLEQK